MGRALIAICIAVAAVSVPAHACADPLGFYYEESGGVTLSRGRLGDYMDGVMHLRVGVGVRDGSLAFEPWLSADVAGDRDGALFGFVGGRPAAGGADLASYGVDAKYLWTLWRHLEVYARGGPLYATGTGALGPYHGFGIGGGAGIQLTGSVRALGFLFLPLFWSKRGPLVTGGVFIDEGVDYYALRDDSHAMPPIDSRVGHLNAGFAIGSSF
jgi:hypothetical protein